MKKYIIFCLILAGMASCTQNNAEVVSDSQQETLQPGQFSMSADPQLQNILDAWITGFIGSHRGFEIYQNADLPDLYLHAEYIPASYDEQNVWKITVMKEGLIPVVSDQNPYRDVILEKGINKDMLARAFTEETSWGELLGISADEQVNIFLPVRGRGLNRRWAEYLGVSPERFRGEYLNNRDHIIEMMKEDPFRMGIMNACCCYDHNNNKAVDGIMAIPIDFNENGRIDAKESFYEDLCRLERAVYLGILPRLMCSEIYLVAEHKPTEPAQIEFISWMLTKGQKLAEEHGYARIRYTAVDDILDTLASAD